MTNYLPSWITVLAALLTPTIAAIVAVIAWLQYKTARAKLKFDLFEKRFAIHNCIATCLAETATHGNANDELLRTYLVGTRDSPFLFDTEFFDYTRTVYNKLVRLNFLESQISGAEGELRTRLVNERETVFDWLTKEMMNLQTKMMPYLSFSNIR